MVLLPYLDMLLRPAEPDDAIAVARVHVRSWQTAYRTLLPDDYLDQLRPEDRAQKYDFASLDPRKPRTIVATEEGLIHGFATTAPSREADLPDHGELCALYVDPDQWGRGIGMALVSAARASHLRTRISKCGSVGPSGQRSCGWLLSNRSVGTRWPAANRLSVGCNGRRSPLSARTLRHLKRFSSLGRAVDQSRPTALDFTDVAVSSAIWK
jgi:GNAT superfamily N-acetyltransferase